MTDNILQIRDLNMQFDIGGNLFGKPTGTVRAVDHVTFDVLRGETFGIVGESGSGKTTLGRCIIRILQPNSGSIIYTGKESEPLDLTTCTTTDMRAVWRNIRMVFQDPQSSLNPRLPVIELIGQSLVKSENLKCHALAERVAELLHQVGLRPEIMHRYPGAFSGGQRQRLGIARALATNPELVIADEAVSALDVSIQAQTLNLLQDLQDKFELTYVFIAHDLAVVEHICDRVAVMYLGQIVELATTDVLFNQPKHPYTRELLSAVPVPDPRERGKKSRLKHSVDVAATDTSTGCHFAPRCTHATDLCHKEPPMNKHIDGATVLCHFAGEI